jgi:ABC-type polysaccharide/polyol phosphate export permease
VDTLVGTVVLILMMAYYRTSPGWAILFLPSIFIVQVLFTAAVGFILSMANLFYRDVKYLFEVAITLWMFATSVLYPTNVVTGKIGLILRLNPMTAIIDGYRDVLLYGRSPFSPAFAWTALVACVAFVATGIIFHRAEFRFAESV